VLIAWAVLLAATLVDDRI